MVLISQHMRTQAKLNEQKGNLSSCSAANQKGGREHSLCLHITIYEPPLFSGPNGSRIFLPQHYKLTKDVNPRADLHLETLFMNWPSLQSPLKSFDPTFPTIANSPHVKLKFLHYVKAFCASCRASGRAQQVAGLGFIHGQP